MNVFDLSARLMLDKSEFEQGLNGAISSLASFADSIVNVGKLVYNSALELATYGDNIDKMSQRLNLSSDAYQRWDYVLKLCGSSADSMQTSIRTLANVIYDAGKGTDSAIEKLSALGLSFEDLSGLNAEDQFKLVVERLQGMEAGAERTAIATDLLGRSAQELAPLFNMTAEEMEQAIADTEKYGMIMSEDAVQASADFIDAQTKLQSTMQGARANMTAEFLPTITDIMNGLSDLAIGAEGAGDRIKVAFYNLKDNFGTLGQKLLPVIENIRNALIQQVPSIISGLGSALASSFPTLAQTLSETIPSVIETLVEVINTNLPMLVDCGLEAVANLIDGIATGMEDGNSIAGIVECVLKIAEAILDNIDSIIDAGIHLLTALIDGLISALPILTQKAPEIITKLVEAFIENQPKLIEAGIELVVALASGLIENIPLLAESAVALVGELYLMLKNKAPEIALSVVEWIASMKEKLIEKWEEIKSKFKTLFDDWISNIKGFYTNFHDVAKEWIDGLISKIKEKWEELLGKVKGWIDDFVQKFKDNINAIEDIGKNIVDGILDGIKTAWDTLTSWVTSAWETIKKIFVVDSVEINPTTPTKTGGKGFSRSSSMSFDSAPMAFESAPMASNNNGSAMAFSSVNDSQIQLMREQNQILMNIYNKDTVIKTDSLFDAMQNQSVSYTKTTGLLAF